MNIRSVTICLVLLLFSSSLFSKTEQIILVADEWYPYNGNPASDKPGYVVELAKKIFQQQGYEIIYKTTSWSRAIFGTRNGDFDGIICTGKRETPDFVFPVIEQGIAEHTFYVLENNPWRYQGFDSLSNMTLGAIENYSYGIFYEEYIVPNSDSPDKIQLITGHNPLLRNLQKLKLGRINVLIEDQSVIKSFLLNNEIDIPIKAAGIAKKEKLYIAFSPSNEDSVKFAEILSNGVKELRANGQLKNILSGYGLTDWVNE